MLPLVQLYASMLPTAHHRSERAPAHWVHLAPRTQRPPHSLACACVEGESGQPAGTSAALPTESTAVPGLLVVMVGMPGAGKSTFAELLLAHSCSADGGGSSRERWSRISQDVLGSRKQCIRAAREALRQRRHVLIDRCNFDPDQRAHWLNLGGARPASRVAVFLDVPEHVARRRVLRRATHEGHVDSGSKSARELQQIVRRISSWIVAPRTSEGFDRVVVCRSPEEAAAAARSLAAEARALDTAAPTL
ncbi:hypothetical protein EMIHUDRAFT_439705 [Emiliania huxleyi CCMP1516]|uniref:Uncharacterized protein n=3 Tax=Emiliania huxleyi TaxID=2903 RepID=A0A0D3JCY6_EMIH1|nr:hypothetical protein EMIHUDRAFT_444484 [Emiliania huxleyi CCMP1516]XP_005792857.1 hypothetical protein EMIHUDRAFT_439705 [Emiliania huxleyi CCMP1516]EOD21371.1 hypothetical protein EMIHUDRAFT_444484 [Emiliania huxleyi CCMP1516]EOD40428.1 hypothetical protein EMIHUDRAFT_439705 [Emiliania huxleyi CCMP1516]|eukprot:XP_005773800.1 hypothetical protein EMIHUDRAFT_444484 [Emiliania huxleyi CCMP1516]